MHTVAKKPAPLTPPSSLHAAQESGEMSRSSAATAAAASSPEDQQLTILLPDGSTALVFINPSKPMMDLLIKICGQLRLNPAEHSLQVFMGDSSWPVSYKANQTLSSLGGASTVKLVSKKSEKDKLKTSTQQPFEITQRLIVSLPNNQKYVMRVKPNILLSELFNLATAHKGLDPQNYKLCHPSNPDLILNMDSPLNVYGISEICLINTASGKATYHSEHQNIESDMHGRKRLTASISEDQSSVPAGQTGTMTSAPRSQLTASNRHTMQKSPSLPGPDSSGFMPSTSFEKKKGFLSFLKRKKSGKFSFGGSMQNLHQIDSGSAATLSKQKLDTPMSSESQLHRTSQQTSSIQVPASASQQICTTATTSQLQLQIPAASKKRPAPQPPGVLLPLTTDSGTGRLVRPPPRLSGSASHPVMTRSGVENSVRLAPQVPFIAQPSQMEGTGDVAIQLTNGIGHSPSSSHSSGFEEMSPSPSEESTKPTFAAAGSVDKPDSAVLNMNGGVREGGVCTSSAAVNSGSTGHFDFGLLQTTGKAKRKAPAPPAVAVQPPKMPVNSESAASTKPTPPSSLSSDNSGSSFPNDATTGSPGVNSLSSCPPSRDEHLLLKNPEANNEQKSTILRSAATGQSDGFSASSGTVPCAVGAEACSYSLGRRDAQESGGNLESGQPCAEAFDDEDGDVLAAEAEDCFCETDINYDGEIVFDCTDFTFVTPEVLRPSASMAAALSKRSMTSEHCGKSVTESCSANKLNLKAVKVDDTSQLPGFVMESKAANVFHSTESEQEVRRSNLKPTSDDSKVLESYDSHANSEDSSNGVAIINGQFLDKRDSSSNNADGKLLGQTNISDESSQAMSLNNVSGNNDSSESAELNYRVSTEEILNCSGLAVLPVAFETQNETITTTPNNIYPDKTMENDSRCSAVDVEGSASMSLQQTETTWEPRTIIINKSKSLPMYAATNAPEVCKTSSVQNSLEPQTTDGSELQSQTTVLRVERTANQLSDETREKLSNDSFLLDRSLCSRFYPSMNMPLSNSSDAVNETNLSCANFTAEQRQSSLNYESAQIKSDPVIPTFRSSESKSECSRKPLYHLVRHSPPVATDDFKGALNSCGETVDCNESKPVLHVSEQQTFKPPEKVDKHSTNVSFTAELQRHLSRWQQQHPISSGALPEKSATVTYNSDANPSTPVKNPSCFKSAPAPDVNGTKEVKDRQNFVNSTSGQSISSLPATSGSLVIATASNPRSSAASGSNSLTVANNKGLNKQADVVVFTMEQLLNAKSSLKRTGLSENPSEVSQNEATSRSQNHQTSVKETKYSTRSVTSTTVKVLPSPEASNGGVCSSVNNIPVASSLPAFVGNHVEKKTGGRNVLASKPQQEVNVRDELLTAIRNAGGKPMKCKVASG